MVKSKKTYRLILGIVIVLAVCALCALGASAAIDFSSSDPLYSTFTKWGVYSSSSQGSAWGISSIPYDSGWGYLQTNGQNQEVSVGFCVELQDDPVFPVSVTFSCQLYYRFASMEGQLLNSGYEIITSQNLSNINYGISHVYSSVEVSYSYTYPDLEITATFLNADELYKDVACCVILYQPEAGKYPRMGVLIDEYPFSNVYNPDEYDPENPYNGYSQFEPGVFFTNQKLYSDSTYSTQNIPINMPSRTLDYIRNSDVLLGCMGDGLTDIIASNNVIAGQIGLEYYNSFGADYQTPVFDSVTCYMVSSSEISSASVFEVPSTWTQRLNLGVYQESGYDLQYIFDFYLVFPDDLSTVCGFAPVNILFQFNYSGNMIEGTQSQLTYKFLRFNFHYKNRSSSSAPIPDAPDIILPSDDPVKDNLIQEYEYYNDMFSSTDDQFSEIDQPINEFISGFFSNQYVPALTSLANAMNYSGTDFSIRLPSAKIPAITNVISETNLWAEQEIPFKTAYDGIPIALKTIFGFIVLFSGASFCVVGTISMIRKLFIGDMSIER